MFLSIRQADIVAERREALHVARLGRILDHVEARWHDQGLSAHTAARALGMSVRSLHLALAPTGETFGELVARRRLAACQASLSRPGTTIAGVAFACGFNSLSSYYRAFRRACACKRQTVPATRQLAA